MERECPKCSYQLAENDFLCPKCGAIYGEPVYEAPKQEEQPAPAPQKQHKLPLAVVPFIGLLIVIACVLIWNPFRPAETTPTTAPIASTFIPPATSALPTPPPTTLPPTVPTTVPTTVPLPTTIPPTVPATTLADNQRQLNWTMDAKVVDTSGKLIGDGTVTINGIITDHPEISDTLSLSIGFPPNFPHSMSGYQDFSGTGHGVFGPYYICTGYVYDNTIKDYFFLTFALDPEAECALFILPDVPEQYLVCSTVADVNVEEVMAHFQKFLDAHT